MCIRDSSKSMGDASSSLGSLMDQLDASVDGVYDLSSSASADLTQINKALDHSCKLLDKASAKISDTTGKISQMQSGGDFSQLEEMCIRDRYGGRKREESGRWNL